jgi:predicted metalloprotease
MARWDRISQRGNVTDRRGLGIGGLGVAGIGVTLLVTYLTGGDVIGALLNIAVNEGANISIEDPAQFEGEDAYETFASTVLGSADAYWSQQFAAKTKTYQAPELVLFRGRTTSACGGASAMSGPHYCPLDATIYLDETFFDELSSRLGAAGGDVAEAYVIAHEVGHHVQNELDLLTFEGGNEASVTQELQADCFAGLWLGSLKGSGVLAEEEIREALDAASSVGDDNIQRRTSGEVQPETWTHGSSEDRMSWFERGYDGTSIESCQ